MDNQSVYFQEQKKSSEEYCQFTKKLVKVGKMPKVQVAPFSPLTKTVQEKSHSKIPSL